MKKINFLTVLATALLVSSSLMADLVRPMPESMKHQSDREVISSMRRIPQEGNVAKIGDTEYATLQDAVNSIETTDRTTVTLLQSVELTATLVMPAGKDIVIELNGNGISLTTTSKDNSATISNSDGTLTIQDSSDSLKKGTGNGFITMLAKNPSLEAIPTYASNAITNSSGGTLNILSGRIENLTKEASATYAVDNTNSSKLNVSGGYFAGPSQAIRVWVNTTTTYVTMTGGVVRGFWMQDGSASDAGVFSFKDVVFTDVVTIGYYYEPTNVQITFDHCEFTAMKYELDPTKGTNSLVIKNNISGQVYLEETDKILQDGYFTFPGEFSLGWIYVNDSEEYREWYGTEVWKAKGVRIDYNKKSGNWYGGYLSAEGHMHGFYDYIKDGYGMVCEDAKTRKFQIVSVCAPKTGFDPDSTLSWSDEIWNSTPDANKPVEVTHDVVVKDGTNAEAATVIVSAGYELTIQSGGVLNVGDGGLKLNNGSKLIVEPGAFVLVGYNGVICDDVNSIVIKSDALNTGNFLLDPRVVVNGTPLATVQLHTQVGISDGQRHWQRFGSPVSNVSDWSKSVQVGTVIYGWDYATDSWKSVTFNNNVPVLSPFVGYAISNQNSMVDGQYPEVIYSFEGNLSGNVNGALNFTKGGYNYFSNGYTGIASAKEILADAYQSGKLEGTLWKFNSADQNWWTYPLGLITDGLLKTELNPMELFILKLTDGQSATIDINYEKSVWNNTVAKTKKKKAPEMVVTDYDAFFMMNVTAGKGGALKADQLIVSVGPDFTEYVDQTFDATKLMNEGVNLYATNGAGDTLLSSLAVAELDKKYVTLVSKADVEMSFKFESVSGETEFYLVDKDQSNTKTLIVEGATYTCTVSPNQTISSRFYFEKKETPSAVEEVVDNVHVKGIYNSVGQYMGETSTFSTLPAGMYIVDGIKVIK